MHRTSFLFILLCFLLFSTSYKALSQVKKINDLWQKWEDLDSLMRQDKKPVLIDMYTNWCHYCKVMDAATYRNDSVYTYLKSNYYRFKFNAETRDTIYWQNKIYTFNSRYGVHDFAVYLSKGNIVFPTTVIISTEGQPFYQPGLLKPGDIEILLKYFKVFQKASGDSLEDFAKSFKSKWK